MTLLSGDVRAYDQFSQFIEARDGYDQQQQHRSREQSPTQDITTSNIRDHYRPVPLGDGNHILYTDPRTGTLSLGSDATGGFLDRLVCKAQFRPPMNTTSTLPVLYTAVSDTRFGVCVMATFSNGSGYDSPGEDISTRPINPDPSISSDTDKQMIVLYMIPPDVLAVISQGICRQHCMNVTQHDENGSLLVEIDSRPKGSCNEIDSEVDGFAQATTYPLEIRGLPVAICCNLVELALDSGADMILWAFCEQGWARAWALRVGHQGTPHRTVVEANGSLRQVDSKGDYNMTEEEQVVSAPDVSFTALTNAEIALKIKPDTTGHMPPTYDHGRLVTKIIFREW
ncbi:calcium permeable stress-gated cation channel 1 [Fusarium subglutinans]|uniref:Calcium permeable stress-gated cation channel 1 n=1 Tax=Gibberella subglutinans TaxID=42677 RepID=A0A8H5PXP1_GIBSU|nr:calcium permeable stress-gated cation channel 1 [Fusarium subglutinans]KAF5605201.1 calcium permeable stress-gated cation channel 1 [Fusarium subglutinans]